MSDITGFAHPQQVNGAGNVYANNLTLFGNEVIAEYKTMNKIGTLLGKKTILGSKSYQFEVVGGASNDYHAVGTQILGSQILTNKININVDNRPIISNVFLDKAETILNHWDERAKYVRELARSISDRLDTRYLQVIALASEKAAAVTGGPTGTKVTVANVDTDTAVFVTELFKARSNFATKNVPMDSLFCAISPVMFYLLAQENQVINQDINAGVNGGINTGEFMRIAGFTIVMTNHMPTGVVAAEAGDGNVYSGTFTNLTAVCWHPEAAMTLEAMPLVIGSDGYQESLQGTLIVAKVLEGSGSFRPECAYTIYAA